MNVGEASRGKIAIRGSNEEDVYSAEKREEGEGIYRVIRRAGNLIHRDKLCRNNIVGIQENSQVAVLELQTQTRQRRK